jgi:hypothetical protein
VNCRNGCCPSLLGGPPGTCSRLYSASARLEAPAASPKPNGAAERGDENARDRRPDHAPGLPGNRAERDGVGEPGAIDELGDQGQPGRFVERAERVAQRGQHQQVLEADPAEDREGEGDRERRRRQGLGADQQPQAVGAIGEHAAEELEEHQRRALGEAEIAERQRIARHLPRHPGERHVLGAVPQDVEDEADPVEAVVARLEGGEGRQRGGGRRGRSGQGLCAGP